MRVCSSGGPLAVAGGVVSYAGCHVQMAAACGAHHAPAPLQRCQAEKRRSIAQARACARQRTRGARFVYILERRNQGMRGLQLDRTCTCRCQHLRTPHRPQAIPNRSLCDAYAQGAGVPLAALPTRRRARPRRSEARSSLATQAPQRQQSPHEDFFGQTGCAHAERSRHSRTAQLGPQTPRPRATPAAVASFPVPSLAERRLPVLMPLRKLKAHTTRTRCKRDHRPRARGRHFQSTRCTLLRGCARCVRALTVGGHSGRCSHRWSASVQPTLLARTFRRNVTSRGPASTRTPAPRPQRAPTAQTPSRSSRTPSSQALDRGRLPSNRCGLPHAALDVHCAHRRQQHRQRDCRYLRACP